MICAEIALFRVDVARRSTHNREKISRGDMVIYLSGAIEHAPNYGKAWRAQLTPRLRALGHEVYDPASDEKKNLTDEEVRNFRAWKRSDLERFRRTVRKIIDWDLEWIERRADCVICYWDEHCSKGAGTQAELTVGYRRGMPVYLVAGMPVEQISGWILGCATEIFESFEELEKFLCGEKKSISLSVDQLKQESPADRLTDRSTD